MTTRDRLAMFVFLGMGIMSGGVLSLALSPTAIFCIGSSVSVGALTIATWKAIAKETRP